MPRVSGARYGHTNLIARDWRRLADFYERVFGRRVTRSYQTHPEGNIVELQRRTPAR